MGAADGIDGRGQFVLGRAKFAQNGRRRPVAIGDREEQNVFGDVVVFAAFGFFFGPAKDLIQSAAHKKPIVAAGAADPRQPLQFPLRADLDRVQCDPGLGERLGGEAVVLVEEREQQMFDVNFLLPKFPSEPLRALERLFRFFCKPFGIHPFPRNVRESELPKAKTVPGRCARPGSHFSREKSSWNAENVKAGVPF